MDRFVATFLVLVSVLHPFVSAVKLHMARKCFQDEEQNCGNNCNSTTAIRTTRNNNALETLNKTVSKTIVLNCSSGEVVQIVGYYTFIIPHYKSRKHCLDDERDQQYCSTFGHCSRDHCCADCCQAVPLKCQVKVQFHEDTCRRLMRQCPVTVTRDISNAMCDKGIGRCSYSNCDPFYVEIPYWCESSIAGALAGIVAGILGLHIIGIAAGILLCKNKKPVIKRKPTKSMSMSRTSSRSVSRSRSNY